MIERERVVGGGVADEVCGRHTRYAELNLGMRLTKALRIAVGEADVAPDAASICSMLN